MNPEPFPNPRPLSSSFPRQGWPRSPSHAPVAGPSNATRYESADHAAYRATPLRQVNTAPGPSSRPVRAENRTQRSSTVPTRPVLVRAYSGDADKPSRPSTMSRLFFPFSGSRTSTVSRPTQSEITFPSDKDFSIECILQAIEPDIRSTLNSIAEICGRSKLSLANEYGSHIAPLGEICAPTNPLGPVEEASPREEQRGDGHTVILDEANSIGPARDMHPFSFHRYLENLRHTSMMEQNAGQRQSDPPRSPGMNSEAETVFPITEAVPTPFTREFASKPKHNGCDLLAKNASGTGEQSSSQMVTPAVVSEVHLDASADDGISTENSLLPQAALGGDSPSTIGTSGPEIIQSLLGWLKWAANMSGSDASPALLSAEDRLRAMLDRPGNEGVASTAT
ncbi:hypothetical protein N7457_001840 [Penicillium paradoxum]|uniref:uncharacterized protein n=1 Tax=Penicillium paradoxum TaxID=176176 RepID=UPI0025481748|nr:uncharacterized protein N7457_001840 [Penicillium paradoxum]KAJ5795241.1 hypothetical protein N7457_001840 [Penicillium paradoxum]